MANVIKFDVIGQRVGITINNGELRTPHPSKLGFDSLGNFVVITGEVNDAIDVTVDSVYLNSTTVTAPNTMTSKQMHAAIVALFPNSNSGSAGPGTFTGTLDEVPDGSAYKRITTSDYNTLQQIIASFTQ